MLCDEAAEVAICRNGCGQIHSPYWSARKSKAMHERGTGHAVDVRQAADVFICTVPDRALRDMHPEESDHA